MNASAAAARALGLAAPGWVAVVVALTSLLALAFAAVEPYHYERSERLLVNWIGYAHVVVAAALAGVAVLLRGVSPGKALARAAPLFRGAGGLGVIVVLFLWLNLEIANHFARDERIVLAAEHDAARDLTTSLAWGVYALLLLLAGTWRMVLALRWASLALFFFAIGKVFLYDLGHLKGLYRVGSLAGLALSLIAVSLFYQRFVLRRGEARA